MADTKGGSPQAKPKRHIRNYLLDRKFQFKYALLLSGASALLMAAMGALLYVRMQDSERRLQDEARIAHQNLTHEADEAAAMLSREMDASAQQLINRRLACEAPPPCPPCATTPDARTPSRVEGTAGVVTQSSGTACDPEMCKPLCELLGYDPPPSPPPATPAPDDASAPVAPPDPAAADPAAPVTNEVEAPAAAAAPADPAPAPDAHAAEAVAPPEPASAAAADDQARQRELIRKIEETVRAETRQRAAEMAGETRTRLDRIDVDTKARMDELRSANRRDLRAILVALVVVFLLLAGVGIVVTHKVVGPIYRMKFLIGKIDGDHLVLAGKLRQGDELQDLFEAVHQMLDRLRSHQSAEIDALAALVDRLRSAPEAERSKVLDDLDAFRTRMISALDKK